MDLSIAVNYSELLAREALDAQHFVYDYTALPAFETIRDYLSRTTYWVYDGNGRWSTSERMVRLRGDGDAFFMEVWLISGDVRCISRFDVKDPNALLSEMSRMGL